MAVAGRIKEEESSRAGFKKSETLLLPRATLASVESLTLPLVHEVVLLADFQCADCQKRVADIISKMNGETESVVVSLLEKKVTLTCRSSTAVKVSRWHVVKVYAKPLNKFAAITRLFRSSCG